MIVRMDITGIQPHGLANLATLLALNATDPLSLIVLNVKRIFILLLL
jgi:hypothetical protein